MKMRFGSLRIEYSRDVLRPRPWTLAQARWAAQLAAQLPSGPVLELCAGAGHIGLTLAMMARRDAVLVDANTDACVFARANAEAASLPTRVDVRNATVQSALEPTERFALILADPPWVTSSATGRFPEDPLTAIDGGHDGLDLARVCVEVIGHHLGPGGASILQLGTEAQVEDIQAYLQRRAIGLQVQEVRAYEDGVLARLSSTPA